MTDAVIHGIFLVAAALVSGLIAILASRSGAQTNELRAANERLERHNERLAMQVRKLLRQIEAYHLLEDIYANDLAGAAGNKAARTVKTDYRDKVVAAHQCERPAMTANEARKSIRDAI